MLFPPNGGAAHRLVRKRMPIRPNCHTVCVSSLGTRTHLCEAGYPATSENSCITWPSAKYRTSGIHTRNGAD